jgi:hypothetical protein
LVCQYRRHGSRGPAGRLLYDPARIDPEAWLTERLGDVEMRGEPEPVQQAPPRAAPDPVPDDPIEEAPTEAEPIMAAASPAPRTCEWFVPDGRALRHCGRESAPGLTWCEAHIARSAMITGQRSLDLPPFDDAVSNVVALPRRIPLPVERLAEAMG